MAAAELKKAFGNRLRAARKRVKLSQAGLAQKCGWQGSQGRIGNYEAGERWPSVSDILLLSKHVRESPQALLFGPEGVAEPAGQYALDLSLSADQVGRIWGDLPVMAQDYVSEIIFNIIRFQEENPAAARVVFAKRDPRAHASAMRRIEQVQAKSRKRGEKPR